MYVCVREDIPFQEAVAFGGQDWRQRDEIEGQQLEGVCAFCAECTQRPTGCSQGSFHVQ